MSSKNVTVVLKKKWKMSLKSITALLEKVKNWQMFSKSVKFLLKKSEKLKNVFKKRYDPLETQKIRAWEKEG